MFTAGLLRDIVAIMTNNMQKSPNTRVGILAYDAVQMSAVLGLVDVFAVAARIGEPLGAAVLEGVVVRPDQALGAFDVVIIPPSLNASRAAPEVATLQWIDRQAKSGALMCSVCAGAFLLGHAGLLDGRPVTTHWALEAEFGKAFPKAELNPEEMLIDDGSLITAGGVMAWVDLGLHLVARFAGGEVMAKTARHLLVDPPRRAQSHYKRFQPVMTHGDAGMLSVQRWLEGQIAAPVTVAAMARYAGCSARSLLRRFARATGLSPHQYLQQIRIERARGFLERGQLPVGEVAYRVGYQDISAFNRVFRQLTGLTPSAYRKRFYCR